MTPFRLADIGVTEGKSADSGVMVSLYASYQWDRQVTAYIVTERQIVIIRELCTLNY